MAITPAELVSYLRDPEATEENTALVVGLANGLIDDEMTSGAVWPTWVKILALEVAERGWIKFADESLDDWRGKRAAAAGAMILTTEEKARLADLDGRTVTASAYSVQVSSPLDIL